MGVELRAELEMCWVLCCSFCGTCAVEQVLLCWQRADSVWLQWVPGSCSCSQEQSIDHHIPKTKEGNPGAPSLGRDASVSLLGLLAVILFEFLGKS